MFTESEFDKFLREYTERNGFLKVSRLDFKALQRETLNHLSPIFTTFCSPLSPVMCIAAYGNPVPPFFRKSLLCVYSKNGYKEVWCFFFEDPSIDLHLTSVAFLIAIHQRIHQKKQIDPTNHPVTIQSWLVVSNMAFFIIIPSCMGCHPSHWRTTSYFSIYQGLSDYLKITYGIIYNDDHIGNNPFHW